jgi:hypothetical protein
MADYQVWLARDDGAPLTDVPFETLDYTVVLHDVGALSMALPPDTDWDLFAAHRRLTVYRDNRLESVYLITRRWRATDAKGLRTMGITAYDGKWLLGTPSKKSGRVVAYVAGSTQARMYGPADDLCKQIVRDNLTSPTGTSSAARTISSEWLVVQPNAGLGPSLRIDLAWANCLVSLQDIANSAYSMGTPTFWDVVPVNPLTWEFRTSLSQPGLDHSYPDGDPPVLLTEDEGTLLEPKIDEDYTDEITYVYGGGSGSEAARVIVPVEDTVRSGRSIFGRREAFVNASGQSGATAVQSEAYRALYEGRPKLTFTGKVQNTAGCRYGIEWAQGYRVSAEYFGYRFDCIVPTVHVSVDSKGKETIDGGLWVVE